MHHPIMGYEHLHRHSEKSILDGFAKISEYAEYSKEANQKFLVITDHGTMAAVPEQISEADKHGLTPVFGIELYVNRMQPKSNTRQETAAFRASLSPEEQAVFGKSNHLLGLAYTDQGYSNLVRLSSWAWIHGYYKKPRVNHEILMECKEGIIFTSTCANSEIANAFFAGGDEAGFEMLEKYLAMFGENFYLELMMLDFKLQKPYDAFLLRAHDKYGTPLILSQDCLTEGTIVSTIDGSKRIEDIQVGEFVLTHKNRFRKVKYVNKRKLDQDEKVYRVKTRLGTYAWELTGNHVVRVKKCNGDLSWKRADELTNKDRLVIPKINKSHVFAQESMKTLDLMQFIDPEEYIVGESTLSSRAGNMMSKLRYIPDLEIFSSYYRWSRDSEIRVPRYLPLDDDFLKIIGLYIAEGSAEINGTLFGFGLHKDEVEERELIERFFTRFGIKVNSRQVSENGISLRFSSRLFNSLFKKLCGFTSSKKHLPYINGTFFKQFTEQEFITIFGQYWKGDGTNPAKHERAGNVGSTSKLLIYDLASVLNSLGFLCVPCKRNKVLKKHKNPNADPDQWKDWWYLTFGANKRVRLHNLCYNNKLQEKKYNGNRKGAMCSEDEHNYYLKVRELESISYDGYVYNFEVEEDESYVANCYALHNCHYCRKEHSHFQRLMLMRQTKRTIQDIEILAASGTTDLFELQDQNLWMKTESELNEKWESDYSEIIDYELYKQSKANTVAICQKAANVKIDRRIKLPKFPDEELMLREEIEKGRIKRLLPNTPEYNNRIKEELDLICEKGFVSYFLIQKMMIDEARRKCPELLGFGDGSEAVGPGRGSFCGSLVAYCLELHDVEPIKHGLLFSRFLSPTRGGKQMKVRFTIDPLGQEEAV